MGIATGTVVAGKVVVEGLRLVEGSVVTIVTHESDDPALLTSKEEDELLEARAQASRGETISADELFARLDQAAKS